MPLRIGFDLDGVFADMDGELVRQSHILFGQPITRGLDEPAQGDAGATVAVAPEAPAEHVPALRELKTTARQQRRLWHHVETIENFWETLAEFEPGAIQRLAAEAAARRWELIFLTKRPETVGATSQVQSQRWLAARGFPLPSVYVVQGSRGRIADALALDFVVDDRPENCLDVVVDSKAQAMLLWRDDVTHLPAAAKRLGIRVVKSLDECLGILTALDPVPAPQQPGVIDRMKRLLGLKEPAGA